MSDEKPHLERTLKPLHVWGLAVGLVISGEYFGWSYGWAVAGTVGFLVATLVVAVLYTTFVFSFTELTTSIPEAGGAFTYAERALGPWGGFFAGFAALVEFLFAPPAIAFALGSYLHVVHPGVPVDVAAILVFLGFCVLNLVGVKQSARFELVVTLLAVVELLVFLGVAGPHFSSERFMADPLAGKGALGMFAAVPYAIWFFLGIEGVAMASEEVVNPRRSLPIGYITGIVTLVVLAIGVMLAAGGVGDWHQLTDKDYPIPGAIEMALGQGNPWVKAFASIGLFGLLASLNGIVYSASRQLYAVARRGLLPEGLTRLNRFKSPWVAVVSCTAFGIACILSGKTAQLITLSGIGAVLMYAMSMVSLFVLRKKEPELERSFRAPLYPYFPAIALILSGVSLVAMVAYNPMLAAIFVGLMGAGAVYFQLRRRKV